MSRLVPVRLNPLVTLQDAGRTGAMRFGVAPSGPMDRVRFALALRLAGDGTAAFEVGIAGAAFRAEGGGVALGVAGPGFALRIGGRTIAAPVRLVLADGETAEIVPGAHGMWAYVAAAGLQPGRAVLGSVATNARTGLGAQDLAAGFACATAAPEGPQPFVDPYRDDGAVGILPGPQHHLFADPASFGEARLTAELDRMGYRLEAAPLTVATHDIVSDGVVAGAIQIPGDGRPIVQMADSAPTGGYPKLAVVAAADLPRLAQRRPGDAVRFEWIDDAEAARRRAAVRGALDALRPRTVAPDPAVLARENLVGGVWG